MTFTLTDSAGRGLSAVKMPKKPEHREDSGGIMSDSMEVSNTASTLGRLGAEKTGWNDRHRLLDSRPWCGARHTWAVAPSAGFDFLQLKSSHGYHEVSMNGGRTGARTSTPIIRPSRQTGHCRKEEPVNFS
jgi:hypothetical protein